MTDPRVGSGRMAGGAPRPSAQIPPASTARSSLISSDVLLSVRDLRTHLDTRRGVVRAVDGVSFDLRRGETLGIVGESGSGKSMTALSIMRLLPRRGQIVGGQILLDGEDLVT